MSDSGGEPAETLAGNKPASVISDADNNGKENESEITLYYFPTSFSSQKVLLAAYEKGIKFKPRLVSLFHGQHMEPWYVKLNPEGTHVPVLVKGNTILNDPEDIIDYIDTLKNDATLVPDVNTPEGQVVKAVREQLNAVAVDVITYGVVFHPHLSASGCHMPSAVQRSMRENFARRLQYLTHKATQYPELRDGYLAKSQTAAHKYDIITDEEKVKGHLSHLDSLFQDMETLLAAAESKSGTGCETWLFGPTFTAADIALSVLLHRLLLLGLDARFFPAHRCPHTHRYMHQLLRHPPFLRIQKEVSGLRFTLLWEDLKAASPYVAVATGVGVTAALAYWLLKRAH